MLWPVLTCLAIAGMLLLQFWWSRKLRKEQAASRHELERLRQSQQQAAAQVQSQQDALFDSMAEGLLLLDETGRIQLANRAFAGLFGVTNDVHHKTIIEALRLHELSRL